MGRNVEALTILNRFKTTKMKIFTSLHMKLLISSFLKMLMMPYREMATNKDSNSILPPRFPTSSGSDQYLQQPHITTTPLNKQDRWIQTADIHMRHTHLFIKHPFTFITARFADMFLPVLCMSGILSVL